MNFILDLLRETNPILLFIVSSLVLIAITLPFCNLALYLVVRLIDLDEAREEREDDLANYRPVDTPSGTWYAPPRKRNAKHLVNKKPSSP